MTGTPTRSNVPGATLNASVCRAVADICLIRELEAEEWGQLAAARVLEFVTEVQPGSDRSARWVALEFSWRRAAGAEIDRLAFRAGREAPPPGSGTSEASWSAVHAVDARAGARWPESPQVGIRIGIELAGDEPPPGIQAALGLIGLAASRALEVTVLVPLRRREALLGRLTDGQQKTLPYLLEGLSEREIGARMERSAHTVHDHVKGIYGAWGVASRRDMMAVWLGERGVGSSAMREAPELIVRPLDSAGAHFGAESGDGQRG